MQPLWAIENLVEALSQPQQLSPLLARNYHPVEPIKHNYRIECDLIRIPLSDGAKRWLLTIPTKGAFEGAEHEIRAKCLITQHSPLFVESHYIRSAVTLFSNNGAMHTLPALLQEEMLPLFEFLRLNYSAQNTHCLRRALESVALSATKLIRGPLSHNNLSHHNVGFDRECHLRISDLPIARGDTDDMEQLAKAAILIYIAASQKDAYKILATRSNTNEEFRRRLRAILASAEHYAISPLVKLVEGLLHGAGSESLAHTLGELATEPFRAMPLLTGLLSGKSEHPTTPHTYLPEEAHSSLKVDFGTCEEVLPAGNGLVRYRLRGLWGYAHTDGNRLPIERILLYAEEFHNDRAVVKTARGYGLMNSEGQMVMNDVWEDLGWHHTEGIVTAADKCGKWRIYDSLGRQLSTVACDWLGGVAEGYIVGKSNGKFGYLSTSGEKLTNFIYDEAYSFCNGLALVCFKGSYYHIDTTFHRIAPHEEEFIQRYRGLKTTP